MKIKSFIKLLIAGILLTTAAHSQIYDTSILRNYINANIVPNSSRQITGTQINNIFNGLINTVEQTTPAQVQTLSDLMHLNTRGGAALVKDPHAGGMFSLSNTGVVDSVIVFPAANGKYWVRQWDKSTINAAWAGLKGDGSDESRALNRIIETFSKPSTADTIGIAIKLPAGVYRFKNIKVRRGIKIYADQYARNNVSAYVPTKIYPAAGANYIFEMEGDTLMNSGLENLYIDGDYSHNPQLISAVKFNGSFNILIGNNIVFCAHHAVYSTAGAFIIRENNFQGMFGTQTFSAYNDFKGTLHIVAAGDAYLQNNEIGAAAPYLAGQVPNPINILRDPAYRRVVAMYAGYLGNSYVENNLFENGDQGAVINGAIYGNYKGNRYEMNGGGGIRLRNVYNCTFTDEKFANNSLAANGGYSDLVLDTGAVAYCTFAHPTFLRLTHPAIPTSTFKVRFNIVNYTGPGGNTLITPSFADVSARYDSLGHFDNTAQAAPFNWVEGQWDPKNPVFAGATIGYTGDRDGTVKGGVQLIPGTTIANGGRVGAINFLKPDNNPSAQIGFNNDDNLNFSLLGTNKQFIFGGGTMTLAKSGASSFNIQSNDVGGNTAGLNLYTDPLQSKVGGLSINPAGLLSVYASNSMGFTLFSPGIFTFQGGGITTAKAGGTNLVMISDNTGVNQIHMSSDAVATRVADITLNNVTGDLSLTATRDISLGAANNLLLKQSGLIHLPTPPTPATTGFDFIGRNSITGELIARANVYWDSIRVKSEILAAAGGAPTLNSVTSAGNSTPNLINVGGIGSSGPAVFGGGFYPSLQTVGGSTALSVGGYTTTVVNNTGAATITLPSASAAASQVVIIVKVSAASNDVTIAASVGDTINGGPSKILTLQYSSVILQSNGTAWLILSAYSGGSTL